MSWIDRIIFFGAGYIIGTSGYEPPNPFIHWTPEELRVLGYQIAIKEEEKIKIGIVESEKNDLK